jgi:RNA polymerase-binding transcription factor
VAVKQAFDLKALRRKLEEKRREVIENVARARAMGNSDEDAVAPDIADRATNAFQREFSYSLSENENRLLRLVDDALVRLAEGKYGMCTHCGEMIEKPRLEAIPWARHCIACQELQDRGEL